MSSLDDKLKEILQAVWKDDNMYFANEGLDYDLEGNSSGAITLIKRAFQESGYVHIPQVEIVTKYERGSKPNVIMVNGNEVMTGAEWYERFNWFLPKELPETSDTIVSVIREAAKRASGLDTEG